MNQPRLLVRRVFLHRLSQARTADPQGWVLVEDLSREAFGLPAVGVPIAGPTAKGTLSLPQRASVRAAIHKLSSEGLVEFAEQLPTERRRVSRPGHLGFRRRSTWARLAGAPAPTPERRERDAFDDVGRSV